MTAVSTPACSGDMAQLCLLPAVSVCGDVRVVIRLGRRAGPCSTSRRRLVLRYPGIDVIDVTY